MRYLRFAVIVAAAALVAAGAAQAADLSGRVVDADGKPVAQATVTIAPTDPEAEVFVRMDGPGKRLFYELKGPTTQTDDKGAFGFEDLAPGWYGLTVVPAAEAKLAPLGEPFNFRVAEKAVDLGTVSLPPPPARIVGRILVEGKAPEDGMASIYDPIYGVESDTVPLDDEGNFAINLLRATGGRVALRVVAFAEGAEGFTIRTVKAPAGGRTMDLGTVNLGNVPQGGLTGYVTDAKGKRIKRDFLIYAYDPKKPFALPLPPVESKDGEFVEDLPGGRWRLLFAASGQMPITRNVTIDPASGRVRRLVLKLPETTPEKMTVGLVPMVGRRVLAGSVWKEYPLPDMVVVVRGKGEGDAPLWALPWSWIAPGEDAALPAPDAAAAMELWQVERTGTAFRPVRKLASTGTAEAASIRWDVVAFIRAACEDMIRQGEMSAGQAAANLEILADFLSQSAGKSEKALGAELARLAGDLGSAK